MTARGVAKDFGRYLQSCRRSRGISLGVVSDQTRITLDNLRQIENERLDQLPSPVFVKGFIKAFALAVGADPAEAILRLSNRLAINDQLPSVNATAPPSWSLKWHQVLLAVLLFTAQIGGTLYLAGWMHNPSPVMPHSSVVASIQLPETATASENNAAHQDNTVSPPLEEAPQPVKHDLETNQVSSQPAETPTPFKPLSDTLELHIRAVEATWLKVVSDDKVPREFLLQADQDVTLKAEHHFNLIIGNAAGIRLVLNDQPVPIVGTSGQVVDLRLP